MLCILHGYDEAASSAGEEGLMRHGPERLYLDQGEDHAGSARGAYGDDGIYSWLLGKRCN